jgi:malate permease and related proteins
MLWRREMDFLNIINQVIILFLIMVVGYVARKKNIINSVVNKGLSELLLNITLPFMIIASFNYSFSSDMLNKALTLLVYSVVIHTFLAVISKFLYYKYPERTKAVLRFITVFSNCGYMGYPVVASIYGNIGVFYTAMFNIPWNLLCFTLGMMFYTGQKDLKTMRRAALNPGVISVCIGLVLFVFSIKLPFPIFRTLELVGSTTTPLSMIIIGSMLADIKIRDIFTGFELYYGCIVRLILIPLVVLGVLKSFGISGMYLGIPVLICAMPAAANTAVFAEKYDGDSAFASRMIFMTTVLSSLTIPLIILLV